MNPTIPWTGRNVRLVTMAWGKSYIDRLLERALAAALAPGNLPALAKHFDCTVVVVTEESLFDYVRAHPIGARLQSICPLRLVALDDLIAEPWQYGITLAYALFRGFSDLQTAMTDTFILFLNADFILADGSYERLIPYMLNGHRALLSPSYCAIEENVTPLMSANAVKNNGAISFTPRELARIILENTHNTIRAKTVNQDKVHFKYADQFYWKLDENTLLGHQMPIALVAVRPEVVVTDINTFWDWGVVYDICPSKSLTVLGDSDEFLMLELRNESTHRELLLPGPGHPKDKAQAMSQYITQYQIDNAAFPLTLHSKELPADIDSARKSLCQAKDAVLQFVTSVPAHNSHSQWIYHQRHLKYWQKTSYRRHRIALLESLIPKIESNLSEGETLDNWTRLASVKIALTYQSVLQKAGRAAISSKYGYFTVIGLFLRQCLKSFIVSILGRAYNAILGNAPNVSPISALWPVYHHFSNRLRHLAENHSGRILVVTDTASRMHTICKLFARQPNKFAIDQKKICEALDFATPSGQKYAACVIMIDHKEMHKLDALLALTISASQTDATILLHVTQLDGKPISWTNVLATKLSCAHPQNVAIQIGGHTQLTSLLITLISSINTPHLSELRVAILRALTLFVITPISLIANLFEILTNNRAVDGRSLTAQIST